MEENEKDLYLSKDIIKNFNKFNESIIRNNNLYLIINKIFFTIIEPVKIKNYLLNSDRDIIKNRIIFQDMLGFTNGNEEMNPYININSEFSIENYKNIINYLFNITNKKEYCPDLLEYCLINALIFVFHCEMGHTINIYLFDNFNKIKRGKTFENLEKICFITDILKEPFQKYIKETIELTFNEEQFYFIDEKKK